MWYKGYKLQTIPSFNERGIIIVEFIEYSSLLSQFHGKLISATGEFANFITDKIYYHCNSNKFFLVSTNGHSKFERLIQSLNNGNE